MEMNKSIFTTVATLALLSILLGGCGDLFEKDDRTFDGEKQVEFDPATATVDERADQSDSPVAVSVAVNLISPQGTAQSEQNINFVVDDSSTAVAGDHYTLADSSPLTIPQGETSTSMQVDVTADNLDDGEVRTLYITLQGNDEVRGAGNYDTLTLNILGVTD